MTTYADGLTDSTRWDGFVFRPGDIVISTPSKCGTTWLQMICALLIFRRPALPAPLTEISPWLDMNLRPVGEVFGRLEAQTHRRFIKTHTPLDGVPAVPGVTFLVAGRDPRDVAVSMDHHRANLSERVLGPRAPRTTTQRDRVLRWIELDEPPATNLASLRGLAWHLGGAWARRHDPDVVLVHYAELSHDLAGQMAMIAGRLGLAVPQPGLIEAASLRAMRERAGELAPDERIGLLENSGRFFRSGATGQWRAVLHPEDLLRYGERLRDLVPADLADWLHSG